MTARTFDSARLQRFGYRQEIGRTLSFGDLVIYGLIYMVLIAPMGIFGNVFQASGGMVALVYLVGMGLMMITASSYGAMAKAYPAAGSVYTYAGRAISAPVGFLAGWTILLDYISVPTLLSMVAAVSMAAVVPVVPVWVWIVGFVVVNLAINLSGIKTTRTVNKVFLAGQLIILAVFIVVAVVALAVGRGRGFSWEPIYTSTQFHLGVVFGGVSVAALSFLGFDALSTLPEDAKGGAKQVSRAMVAAIGVTGLLFIVQSFLAALLVEDPATLIADGDPGGTAFFDAARVAAGPWLATLTAVATALAWGLANNMVAQVGTSRLLYAMARDGQLPRFLAQVSVGKSVPRNAILLTAGVSLTLGLLMNLRGDGIAVMSSLINFGALLSFIAVHVSVMVHAARRKPKVAGFFRTWVLAPVGVVVLIAVIANANVLAQRVGFIWLGVGALILLILTLTGRRPTLAGLDTTATKTGELAGSHA